MEVFKLIGIGILVCITVVVVKQVKPEFAILITISSTIIMFFMIIGYIDNIVVVFDKIISNTNINMDLFKVVLKIVGVGYLIEFAANLCIDSGSPAIADKIILGGKLVILSLCMPIINSLLDVILGLLV